MFDELSVADFFLTVVQTARSVQDQETPGNGPLQITCGAARRGDGKIHQEDEKSGSTS